MGTMRKLKLQVQMTVDGFVAGPDLRQPGRDRARNADFQRPEGAALDRFDGVSQWGRDQYVSAGEKRVARRCEAGGVIPDTSVVRATIGRMTGMRRRISAAMNFPESGWEKGRTSITGDSLLSNRRDQGCGQ